MRNPQFHVSVNSYIYIQRWRHVLTGSCRCSISKYIYWFLRISLALFTFWWWRHNRLHNCIVGPSNCYEVTCKCTSFSLHIDFLHNDIQGRYCKKLQTKQTTTKLHAYSLEWDWVVMADCIAMFKQIKRRRHVPVTHTGCTIRALCKAGELDFNWILTEIWFPWCN